jgi:uncharacterized protein YegP (UPF0339 family)
MSRFTVYQTPQSEFHWKLVGNDDRTLAKSPEGFKSREACVSSVAVVKQEIVSATVDPTTSARTPTSPGTGPAQGAQGVSSPANSPSTNPTPGSTPPGNAPKL